MNEPLVIDIWSDVVCPFCYLGARQLEVALDRFEHRDDVVLRQRAFELDPRAPVDYSLSLPELLAKKYSMPVERARALNERLENDASALGMSWSMKDARPTNTFDAHRVIALSATQDLDRPMSERLFRAYFSEGQLVSDRDVLTALAKEVGVVGATTPSARRCETTRPTRANWVSRASPRCSSMGSSWWSARRAPTRFSRSCSEPGSTERRLSPLLRQEQPRRSPRSAPRQDS